jgi:hypothetical protein
VVACCRKKGNNFAIARRLLLRHLVRGLLHVVGGNIRTIHLRDDAFTGRAAQDIAAQTARDERNHHRGTDNQ